MHAQEYNLTTSKRFLTLLVFIAISNGIVVAYTSFMMPIKLAIFSVMSVYVGYILWRYCLLKHAASLQQIKRMDKDRWLIYAEGRVATCTLSGSSIITRAVSILRFRVENQPKTHICVVFPDTLPQGQYRLFMRSHY